MSSASSNAEVPAEARRNSSPPQAAQADRDEALHAADLSFQVATPGGGDLVRPAAILALQCLDHPVGFEAGDRPLQRSPSQPSAPDRPQVLHHPLDRLGAPPTER